MKVVVLMVKRWSSEIEPGRGWDFRSRSGMRPSMKIPEALQRHGFSRRRKGAWALGGLLDGHEYHTIILSTKHVEYGDVFL